MNNFVNLNKYYFFIILIIVFLFSILNPKKINNSLATNPVVIDVANEPEAPQTRNGNATYTGTRENPFGLVHQEEQNNSFVTLESLDITVDSIGLCFGSAIPYTLTINIVNYVTLHSVGIKNYCAENNPPSNIIITGTGTLTIISSESCITYTEPSSLINNKNSISINNITANLTVSKGTCIGLINNSSFLTSNVLINNSKLYLENNESGTCLGGSVNNENSQIKTSCYSIMNSTINAITSESTVISAAAIGGGSLSAAAVIIFTNTSIHIINNRDIGAALGAGSYYSHAEIYISNSDELIISTKGTGITSNKSSNLVCQIKNVPKITINATGSGSFNPFIGGFSEYSSSFVEILTCSYIDTFSSGTRYMEGGIGSTGINNNTWTGRIDIYPSFLTIRCLTGVFITTTTIRGTPSGYPSYIYIEGVKKMFLGNKYVQGSALGSGVLNETETYIKGLTDSKIEIESANTATGTLYIGIGGSHNSTYCKITIENITLINILCNGIGIGVGNVMDNGSFVEILITGTCFLTVTSFAQQTNLYNNHAIGSQGYSHPYHITIIGIKKAYLEGYYGGVVCQMGASSSVYLSGEENSEITCRSTVGASIGGGINYANNLTGDVTIENISYITAISTDGAGIGSATQKSASCHIKNAKSVTASSVKGCGIGAGLNNNAQTNITISSLKISTYSQYNVAIGAGGNAAAANNSILIKDKESTMTTEQQPAKTKIGIFGNVNLVAVGGENGAGIGASVLSKTLSNNTDIVIGNGNDNPKVTAISGIFSAASLASGSINNIPSIGVANFLTKSQIVSANIRINSGKIYTIDRNACVEGDQGEIINSHSLCIGGPNNETTPTSLKINGGDIYMYGNATFYQNAYSVPDCTNGIFLPSGASLNIGGTPPTVFDISGDAISYPTNYKTIVRNFKDYGLTIETGTSVSIDPNTDIFLDYEYDDNGMDVDVPVGSTATAIHTDIFGRGLGEKFNVPYTYDSRITTAAAKWNRAELQKYIINYIATISPKHPVDYGITEINNIDTVNEWLTPSGAGSVKVVLRGLQTNTRYYIFIRLHVNTYFTGGAIDNNNIKTLEIITTDRRTFKISFLPNGGQGTMNQITTLEDDKLILPNNTFFKIGYVFKNWNTNSSGVNGVIYSNQYQFDEYNLEDNLTLYAIWSANTYKIIFDKNGGTGTMKTLSVKADNKLTLSKNKFKKKGYTFKNWNTQKNGEGTNYKNSYIFTKYILGKNLTLYAIWSKNGSGGSGSGTGGSGSWSSGANGENGSGNDLLTLNDGDNDGYTTAILRSYEKRNINVGIIIFILVFVLFAIFLRKIKCNN